MQGIGLDRVDLGTAAAGDVGAHQAEDKAAEAGRQHGMQRIERDHPRQPHTGIDPEKQHVHQTDQLAHADHHQAGQHADQRRQHDDARLARTHDGAQPMRDFDMGGGQTHRMRGLGGRRPRRHCTPETAFQ